MYLDHVWSVQCTAEQVLRCQFSSAKKAGGVVTHPARCKETRAAEGGQETLSLHCTIIRRHPMAFSVFASHHKSTSVLLTQYSYCLLSKMVKRTETVTWKIRSKQSPPSCFLCASLFFLVCWQQRINTRFFLFNP